MKFSRLTLIAATALLLIFGAVLPTGLIGVVSAAAPCVSSSPSTNAYTVTVCFTAPAPGAVLTGAAAVTATATITVNVAGTVTPRVERMTFFMNNAYLATDFQSPYTFSLPTNMWVDGAYTIQVDALMRDGFLTQKTAESVSFKNGITTPPVNSNKYVIKTGTVPAVGAPLVVLATGDGASGESNSAKVVSLIAAANPNLFLYLGDVYDEGAPAEFSNWYGIAGANYSRFNAITNPTVGNHEYMSSASAAGYFNYWNNVPNYYSFNAGGWHFISLNSNLGKMGTAGASAQQTWLQQDLAAHPNACTIVYYHHPVYNIGPEGPDSKMAGYWSLLAQYHVTIVLNGHDHDYQRWMPLDGNGNPNPNGVTEFVSGGGGHDLAVIANQDSRVAYSNSTYPTALGALKLSLTAKAANFSYLSINGTVLDSGTVSCK